MNEFLDYVKIYGKYHLLLWIAAIGLCAYAVSMFILGAEFIFFGLILLYWIFKDVKIGYGDDKVANLLRLKQLTGERFTQAENEILVRYFGHERKRLILDEDQKRAYHLRMYEIDAISILLGVISILMIISGL